MLAWTFISLFKIPGTSNLWATCGPSHPAASPAPCRYGVCSAPLSGPARPWKHPHGQQPHIVYHWHCWAAAGTQAGCRTCWFPLWQIILCTLVHWLDTVLWTVKHMQLCLVFWLRNLRTGLKIAEKINFFVYLQTHFQLTYNYITCEFSNGVYIHADIQLKVSVMFCVFIAF